MCEYCLTKQAVIYKSTPVYVLLKANPKLTQQIADNLTIKWDLPIKRKTVGDILNQKEFYESDNEGTPQMKMNCCCHMFIVTLMQIPQLQMTVQEFVNIDKDLQTSQDVSDGNIIESVISYSSEDSQTDDDDDIEEMQLTCKQVH